MKGKHMATDRRWRLVCLGIVSIGIATVIFLTSKRAAPDYPWELWQFRHELRDGGSLVWWEHYPAVHRFMTGRACVLEMQQLTTQYASCVTPGSRDNRAEYRLRNVRLYREALPPEDVQHLYDAWFYNILNGMKSP